MARNLIPPPSPGGRPDPDAERRAFHENELLHPAETVLDPPPEFEDVEPAEKSGFGPRFSLLTGALIGFGIAALVLLALVLGSRDTTTAQWSKWQPTLKERSLRIIEIARYVAHGYRLDDGDQMVEIDGAPLDGTGGLGLRVVARTAGNGEGADIAEIDGRTVMFTMTGLGPNGSITGGSPSLERLSLVQREATELALYTFKYVPNVDNVVALLPGSPTTASATASPTPTATSTNQPFQSDRQAEASDVRAMLFRPGDVKSALEQPLEYTLPGTPPRPSTISKADVDQFNALSVEHLFYASVVSDQLGGGILVLDRRPAAFTIEDTLRLIEKG